MTGHARLTDDLLRELFERRAMRGSPDALRDPILATTAVTPQGAGLRVLAGVRPPLRLLAVAALFAAIGGGILLASRPQQPPLATTRFLGFVQPFEYADVPGTGLRAPVAHNHSFVSFTVGGSDPYPATDGGTVQARTSGITLSAAEGAVTHPCPMTNGGASRLPVRADPGGFLEDLRSIAGVGIGNGAATTFDGRAAIALDLDPALARCGYADIHPLGAGGIGQGFVRLDLPSRLVVTQVGSSTILLQAWAPSRAELDTWLPKATEFLDHVHFTDGSSP